MVLYHGVDWYYVAKMVLTFLNLWETLSRWFMFIHLLLLRLEWSFSWAWGLDYKYKISVVNTDVEPQCPKLWRFCIFIYQRILLMIAAKTNQILGMLSWLLRLANDSSKMLRWQNCSSPLIACLSFDLYGSNNDNIEEYGPLLKTNWSIKFIIIIFFCCLTSHPYQ